MTNEEFVKSMNALTENMKAFLDKLGEVAKPIIEGLQKIGTSVEDAIAKTLTKQEILRLPFNINIHKKVFINYLEVVVHPDGTIEYAVPSHSNKLFKIVYEKKTGKKIDLRDENFFEEQMKFLDKHVPKEYYLDMIKWYCNESECVSLWTSMIVAPEKGLTTSQVMAITKLQEEGLFLGKIPEGRNYE